MNIWKWLDSLNVIVCTTCGIEKGPFEFNKSKTNPSGRTTQCRECRKKERGYVRKTSNRRGKGRYDIDHYDYIPHDFMSDKEIKALYKTLKGHMYVKYGRWNDEIIHMTILRGLWKWHWYKPEKASKIVFFQTILWNIWTREINPKTNPHIKWTYSFDWNDNEDNENLSLMNEVLQKVDEYDVIEDIDNGCQADLHFLEDIIPIIESGGYPLIKIKLSGKSYKEIEKETGMIYSNYLQRLNKEREKLRLQIKEEGINDEVLHFRKSMIRSHKKIRKKN